MRTDTPSVCVKKWISLLPTSPNRDHNLLHNLYHFLWFLRIVSFPSLNRPCNNMVIFPRLSTWLFVTLSPTLCLPFVKIYLYSQTVFSGFVLLFCMLVLHIRFNESYDHSLFLCFSSWGRDFLHLFVNDVFFTRDVVDSIAFLSCHRQRQIPIMDLGNLHYFLGLDISRGPRVIPSQQKYI